MAKSTETTPLNGKTESKPVQRQLEFPLNYFPTFTHPYLEIIRLEKRNGIWLMLWPYVLGMTFGAYRTNMPVEQYPTAFLQCVFAAFISRSAACTINDILDKNMDAGVERTKTRPMPSGRISVPAAYTFLFSLYAIGTLFFKFYFTTSDLAFWMATAQMIPLFFIYPWLKRVTYWPQAFLGIAIHLGFAAGWVKVTNTLDYPLLITWVVGGTCWTLLYDTIYACQDMKDDVNVGVHSTAILFGSWIRPILVFFGIVFAASMYILGKLNDQTNVYFVVSFGGTVLHLLWQAATVDLNNPDNCWRNFERNGQLGWIPWAGLTVDYLIKVGWFQEVLQKF
ncbi:4-hydroxybenzoate polyprenyl transferase [Crucibulum laeve]|uniref:4-hydroxybenzoate polyprenyl transferase n=1 Tax=Crucibulum laeve TaxID=68775 RepID=A0A5C3M0S6_9AGAR|nr:4-hydroxybenzoate polyprenyl transferase [Crucibulum laeve]